MIPSSLPHFLETTPALTTPERLDRWLDASNFEKTHPCSLTRPHPSTTIISHHDAIPLAESSCPGFSKTFQSQQPVKKGFTNFWKKFSIRGVDCAVLLSNIKFVDQAIEFIEVTRRLCHEECPANVTGGIHPHRVVGRDRDYRYLDRPVASCGTESP
jgi:hypothetical protein